MNNLIGSLSDEDIKVMLTVNESEFNYLSEKIFKRIDVDQSGYHDAEEIKS